MVLEKNAVVCAEQDHVARNDREISVQAGTVLVVKEAPENSHEETLVLVQAVHGDAQRGFVPAAILKNYNLNLKRSSDKADTLRGKAAAAVKQNLSSLFGDSPTTPTLSTSTSVTPTIPSPLITPTFAGPSERMFYEEIPEGPERDEFLKNLGEKQKKYQQAAFELYVTEADYVRDMRLIIEVFLNPMMEQKVLPVDVIKGIFTEQFPRLSEIHQVLFDNLKELRKGPMTRNGIGKLLENHSQIFQTYSGYFVNHARATNLLVKKREKDSVNAHIKVLEADPRCRNLNLPSFLLKPIQRVMKYPLLLKEMIKYCEDEEEKESLERAMSKIQSVVQHLNEKQRLAENREKIEEIIGRFADRKVSRFVIPSPDFQDKDSMFVMEGKGVHMVNGKQEESLHLFLFNDTLISGKKIGYGKVKSQILKVFKVWKLDSLVVNEGWNQESLNEVIEVVDPDDMFKNCWVNLGAKKASWLSKLEELGVKVVSKSAESAPAIEFGKAPEGEEFAEEMEHATDEAWKMYYEGEERETDLKVQLDATQNELHAALRKIEKLERELLVERNQNKAANETILALERKLALAPQQHPSSSSTAVGIPSTPDSAHDRTHAGAPHPTDHSEEHFVTRRSTNVASALDGLSKRKSISHEPVPVVGNTLQERMAALGTTQYKKFHPTVKPSEPTFPQHSESG